MMTTTSAQTSITRAHRAIALQWMFIAVAVTAFALALGSLWPPAPSDDRRWLDDVIIAPK